MKKSRGLTTMALVIGLLGGSAGAIHGQDAGTDLPTPTLVRGTFQGGCPVPPDSESEADGVVMIRRITFACQRLEASDPRLTGDNVFVGNWDVYPGSGFQLEAGSWTLTTDDGAWDGTSRAFTTLGDGPHGYGDFATDIVTLTGRGAYAGLVATLAIDWTAEPVLVVGAITDRELPPTPVAD